MKPQNDQEKCESPREERRRFLTSTLVLGLWTIGGLPAMAGPASSPIAGSPSTAQPSGDGLSIWLQFAEDGSVTVLTNAVEMGQGTHHAVQQIAAEELAMPLAQIHVRQAPVTPDFIDSRTKNYATFGSQGFRLSLLNLGPVCAAARDMLMRAAALKWGVAATECRVANAAVHHQPSGRSMAYIYLLADAAKLVPLAGIKRKPSQTWEVLGQSSPRFDVPPKVNGSALFGIDVDRPGMLVATVLHAPTFGGTLLTLDARGAHKVRGVQQVVKLPGAVAVVASGYWPALKGVRALLATWQAGPHSTMNSEDYRRALLAAAKLGDGHGYAKGEYPLVDPTLTAQTFKRAAEVIDLTFDAPFLAHATLEPMNAVAEVTAHSAQLWVSTQSALDTQKGVARALGLPQEAVTIHPQLIGGGFGRRLEHDFAVEAALIAREVGKPVKLIWSREVDMRAGAYRPAVAARVRLALGADRMPIGIRADVASPSIQEYSGVTLGPPTAVDWSVPMGWVGHQYAIPALHLNWTRVDQGVPCAYWRSVGASHNVFFLECMLDHGARAAGIDPFEYRRRLFGSNRRRLRFVEVLAERAGWASVRVPGRFVGMAISQGNSAISGHVVELSVPAPGKFRLHRITAAIDVGVIVNPNAVQAQLMGGTLFGLSAALFSEITIADGKVEQTNFDGYRVLKMEHVPPLELLVLGNAEDDRPSGAGEEGVASIGPAIANALLAATGQTITRLPLSRAGWELIGAG